MVYDIVFREWPATQVRVYSARPPTTFTVQSRFLRTSRHGTFARLPSRLLWNTLSAITKQNARRERYRGREYYRSQEYIPLPFPRNYQDHVSQVQLLGIRVSSERIF